MDLQGRKLIVTGGATGIGAAAALRCASLGAHVVIADVNHVDGERVSAAINENGGKSRFVPADVSSESSVKSLVKSASDFMGGVNSLVTAAGIATDSLTPVENIDLISWQRLIDINLTGTFLAAKHTAPAIRRYGGGVMVMIASGAGVRGPSSSVPYGASKGGVNGLAMTLEPALAKDGIRVNVLCPGNISTGLKLGLIDQQEERIGEAANKPGQIAGLGTPEGVARIIGFMLSEDADYLRGALFTR